MDPENQPRTVRALEINPRMHDLKHDEMRAVLARGESINYKGQIISDPALLPSAIDLALASGNPTDVAATEEDIDRQVAALEEQRARIKQAQQDREDAAEAEKKAAEEAEETRKALEEESKRVERERAADPEKAQEASDASIAPALDSAPGGQPSLEEVEEEKEGEEEGATKKRGR